MTMKQIKTLATQQFKKSGLIETFDLDTKLGLDSLSGLLVRQMNELFPVDWELQRWQAGSGDGPNAEEIKVLEKFCELHCDPIIVKGDFASMLAKVDKHSERMMKLDRKIQQYKIKSR